MNWETFNKPLVLAHRGFTLNHVENTLEAVEAALQLGVDGVEVDVQLTADGELVIFHDRSLKRLADQEGNIEEMTVSGLRRVLLKGHKLPTLEELLDLVKDKALLNLEIKTIRFFSSKVEQKLAATLRSFRMGPTILVSSFHPLPLWRLKRIAPNLHRGYLVCHRYVRTRRFLSNLIDPFSLNPATEMITQDLVNKAHSEGKKIFTWNVNEIDDMNRFIELGVDGFFSDRPDKLLRALGRD